MWENIFNQWRFKGCISEGVIMVDNLNYNKLGGKDLLYLIIYSLIMFAGIIVRILYAFLGEFIPSVYNFANYLVLFVFVILFYGKDIVNYFKNLNKKIIKLILVMILVAISTIIMAAILNTTFNITTSPNQEAVKETIAENMGISFLATVIMGPMVEEVVYRHILLGKLSNLIPTAIATIISVIVFAAVHTGFKIEIIMYLPLALGITSIYLLFKKNFIASYVFHVLWNLMAFFVSLSTI